MPVDISTAELRTILRAHPGRKRDGSVRPRGEEAVRTIMSAVTTHYRRVHGEDSGSLGDLTWITADSFDEPSLSSTTQPVREGRAHPDARGTAKRSMEPSGQRRLADNLRSVLMSAAAHINASPDVQADEKKSLLSAWDVEYRGLTDITVRLERDEHRRILSGQLSKRQLENWIHWDDFRSILAPLVQEATTVFGGPDVAALRTEPARFKALQTNVQLAMHALLPPVRNDFAGIRFVEGSPDVADLRESGSPNYVEVAADGSMELVINAYKTDGHTAADDYDPAAGDFVLGLDTTLRIPLVANDTLSKYGFAPEVLGTLLGLYRRAVRTIFGDRNEKEYLFFNFNDRDVVVPIKADALGKRVGRRLKALTGGKQPRSQLFRTMFCTWFLNDADPRPNAQERELMAKMMMHSEERQLCNYNKRVTRSQMPAPKRQRALVTDDDVEGGEL
jgi:hypothetical protein